MIDYRRLAEELAPLLAEELTDRGMVPCSHVLAPTQHVEMPLQLENPSREAVM
jgi:hypothetical protein